MQEAPQYTAAPEAPVQEAPQHIVAFRSTQFKKRHTTLLQKHQSWKLNQTASNKRLNNSHNQDLVN